MNTHIQKKFKKLEKLLDSFEKGRSASADQTIELGQLYRSAVVDLSRAKSSLIMDVELEWMQGVVARAHNQIYKTKGLTQRSVFDFLIRGFPKAIYELRHTFFWASVLFYGTALFAFFVVSWDPDLAYRLFNEEVIAMEEYRLGNEQGFYMGNFTFTKEVSGLIGAAIIINNVRVCAMIFALSCLGCLPGLIFIVYNGLMVGVLCAITHKYGHLSDFLNLIMTHGVLELTAIVIGATGGLRIGWSLIAPGRNKIKSSLAQKARFSASILMGTFLMLLLAGVIEVSVTPHSNPTMRWITATLSTLFLIIYFRKALIGLVKDFSQGLLKKKSTIS
jgi:uncharacterized membrane protein SpoIIM required for sporulation